MKKARKVGSYYYVGKTRYRLLEGSRCQVGNGTAYRTKYGLKKKDLVKTADGRYVSAIKHRTSKNLKTNNLTPFLNNTRKGVFKLQRKRPSS